MGMLVKDTASGNLEVEDQNFASKVAANLILAGPISGSSAVPSFRNLLATDWPTGQGKGSAYLPNIYGSRTNYGNGPFTCPWCTGNLVISGTTNNTNADATNPNLTNVQTFGGSSTINAAVENSTDAVRSLGTTLSLSFLIKLNNTSTIRIWMGLSDTGVGTANVFGSVDRSNAVFQTDTPAAQFVGFRYKGGASSYTLVAQTDASHQTTKNASIGNIDTTTVHLFSMQWDGTNVNFYVDASFAGSISTNLPNLGTPMQPMMVVDNVGTANNVGFGFASWRGIQIG
jgi:hypothetical protein